MALNIHTGKSNSEDAKKNGLYLFFDRSSIVKRSNTYILSGEYVIVPGEGIFIPKYVNNKFNLHQRAYALNSNKFHTKYLYYFLIKNWKVFNRYSVGSTVKSLRLSSFDWIKKHNPPSLIIQKQIIDIIEPFELLDLKIKKLKNDLNNILLKQNTLGSKLMKSICIFNKGKILKSAEFVESGIGFIDIKSMNTKTFSKYVDSSTYEINTNFGDVLLCLDGSPGRLAIDLQGFNGYAYNIKSDTIHNGIIYSSLMKAENQKIIHLNSHGTTIKHASNAKNEIKIYDFQNPDIIKLYFKLLLQILKIEKNIYILKSKVLGFLI